MGTEPTATAHPGSTTERRQAKRTAGGPACGVDTSTPDPSEADRAGSSGMETGWYVPLSGKTAGETGHASGFKSLRYRSHTLLNCGNAIRGVFCVWTCPHGRAAQEPASTQLARTAGALCLPTEGSAPQIPRPVLALRPHTAPRNTIGPTRGPVRRLRRTAWPPRAGPSDSTRPAQPGAGRAPGRAYSGYQPPASHPGTLPRITVARFAGTEPVIRTAT